MVVILQTRRARLEEIEEVWNAKVTENKTDAYLRSVQNSLPPLHQRFRPLPELELCVAWNLRRGEGSDMAHHLADF